MVQEEESDEETHEMMNEKNEVEKMVKVNCSFCGKEIECPEKMLNVDKHLCYECYKNPSREISEKELSKIHVDIPMDKVNEIFCDDLSRYIQEEIFPKLWQERKEKLKELSKKELAELMLIEGAVNGANILFERMKEEEENDLAEESLK